ncbi:MAG: D-alanyl-D-alanine carboxypeptidase [Tissierellia bacterium]|nr:D-alanyl-D-alanine carboxypeptidase [Tissierellia bacterium]
MKRLVALFVLMVILSTYSPSYADDLNLSGESAILIDVDTLEILYSKNPHQKLYPASTTKIMTGILAIELGNMDDIVTVDQEVVDLTDGSHIALEPGEELSLEHLINALLIESANDAALAIAKHISGSIDEFVKLMNEKAKAIGALNTNFVNPNGLPHEEHLSTAYDLALMAKYAMENETFREIVKNYTYTIPITNKKSQERNLWSANRLLYSTERINVNGTQTTIKYEGVNGVKTGYTIAAGQCLVTSYEKDGHKLIAVVLKSSGKNIYSDIHKLLNYGTNNFEKVKIGYGNKFIDNFPVENGVIPFVAGITKSDTYYIVEKSKVDLIEEKITKNTLEAPISKGQVIGKVEYYLEGRKISETDIISTMDIDLIPVPTLLDKIKSKWYLIVFLLLFLIRLWNLNRRRKRYRRRRTTLFGT